MTTNDRSQRGMRLKTVAACAVAAWALAFGPAFADDKIIVGLITKEYTNPFFVKMKEGAEAKAKDLGVDFRSLAGKSDGDNTGQVDAIERLMNVGAKAILITPSDTKGIVPSVERARKAGILVIALDTPLDPPSAADATFATDNLKAGELIGQWAAKTLGDKAKDARVAYVDALADQPSVDRMRDFGFSKGFGIENSDWKQYGHETDKRVVGHQWGQGAEPAAAPRWRRCSRRIRTSTSSIRSTSRARPAPMPRSRPPARTRASSSFRSTADALASRTWPPASSARPPSNIRC